MAYNENLAELLRELLAEAPGISEKKMFGGLAFMVRGHMCCGIDKSDLMLRVGPEAYPAALARPHAREMDFTGKPMKGMIFVEEQGWETRQTLADWVALARRFVETLPPK